MRMCLIAGIVILILVIVVPAGTLQRKDGRVEEC